MSPHLVDNHLADWQLVDHIKDLLSTNDVAIAKLYVGQNVCRQNGFWPKDVGSAELNILKDMYYNNLGPVAASTKNFTMFLQKTLA